jgi:hypothetical protein
MRHFRQTVAQPLHFCFLGKNRAVPGDLFSVLKKTQVVDLIFTYWKGNCGSDGWNRTTDLGVMNPTL